MDGIRQWAFSICVAMVACGIAQLILPKNNLEKVFRLTVSVFFLCCLLSPVVLRSPELRIRAEESAQGEIDRRAARLEEVVRSQSERTASLGIREIVEDKLEEMGINYTDITITINTNEQSDLSVGAVEVVLDRAHEADHDKVAAELESSLGLDFRLGYRDMEASEQDEVKAQEGGE